MEERQIKRNRVHIRDAKNIIRTFDEIDSNIVWTMELIVNGKLNGLRVDQDIWLRLCVKELERRNKRKANEASERIE